MVQTATTRSLYRTAPGHMYGAPGERETETLFSPYVSQQLTITLAGADPFVADATLTIVFPAQDGSGLNITVGPVAIPDTSTLEEAAALVAAAWNAAPQASALYSATSAAAVVTLVAKSYNTQVAAALFVETFSDAHTAVTAQSVAASAPSLEMGLFYIYLATLPNPYAITGTPRGAWPAALPNSGTAIADLAGVIGRSTNATELSSTFVDYNTYDAYKAGQTFPGVKRIGAGVAVRVDPASPAMTGALTQQVHVVIAAGAYSVIGSVAGAADGGNTIRVDNAPTGNILARVLPGTPEESLTVSGFTGRYIPLRLNRTN